LARRSLIQEVYGTGALPDQEAEDRFFNRLRLPNGVYKTTAAHRLDDLNRLVADLLPEDRPLYLMDVAVSSGITTLDWSKQLTAAGVMHTMLAGDRDIEGFWLSFGWANVVLDRHRKQLLYAELFGRGVGTDSRRSKPIVHALSALARYPVLRPRVTQLPLVSPRLNDYSAVTVVQDDVFARRPEFVGRFHALRAANILNRGYFDDVRIKRAIATLRKRLRPHGLLIICRTHENGTNHGTVFRLAGGGCDVVARIGDGSEIEDLAVRG
jgi:hypothetical protein